MSGIIEGLGVEAIWASGVVLSKRLISSRIQITVPGPQQVLASAGLFHKSQTYAVRGTLKRLPKNHQIWLLVQDERTNQVWPQGFEKVQYNPEKKEWFGRVIDLKGKTTRVLAVVAPPTSDDFFRYFQENGHMTKFTPLPRLPPECWNCFEVQANVP